MSIRKLIFTTASALALTAAGIAIPSAANAYVRDCSVWKSSSTTVTAYCKTVTPPSMYRAWAECYKGGSFPQYAIARGPWRDAINHINSVATCGAGFVVASNYGIDIAYP